MTEYVSVHTENGCVIGRLVSDDNDTATVEFLTSTGEQITVTEIPKKIISDYV